MESDETIKNCITCFFHGYLPEYDPCCVCFKADPEKGEYPEYIKGEK